MATFKDYNGNSIEFPQHSHKVEDTKRNGTVALATDTDDGFMSKEDYISLQESELKLTEFENKLKNAVFIKQYKSSKLLSGNEFNSKLKSVGSNAESIIFTKESIPVSKIPSATIVSTSDSEVKSYIYLDGTTIYVSPEEKDTIIYANENCFMTFNNFTKLTSIDLSNFNTSKVTNMNLMFNDCRIKELDVSKFDTSNVISMSGMFNACISLTSIIGINNFNTSNVTDMGSMFNGCSSLTSLDLSNFDTSKVEYINNMFSYCDYLISVNTHKWSTSNVIDMSNMFYRCLRLETINLSNWDTSNVINMSNIFNGCNYLKSLNLSNWDTSKVTNMNSMFYYTTRAKGSITIMNPNTTYSDMFVNCSVEPDSKFTVNYIDNTTKETAIKMVASKSSNSNVVLYGYTFEYYEIGFNYYTYNGTNDPNIYINRQYTSPFYYCIGISLTQSPNRYYDNRIKISNIHMYPDRKYLVLINDQSYFNVTGVGSGFVYASDIVNPADNNPIPSSSFDISNLIGSDYTRFTKAYLLEPTDHIMEFDIIYNYTLNSVLSRSSDVLEVTFLHVI